MLDNKLKPYYFYRCSVPTLAALQIFIGLWVLAFCDQYSSAQRFTPRRSSDIKPTVFLSPSRDALRPLVMARRAIQTKKYDDAVLLLGEVLAEDASSNHLIASNQKWGHAYSVRRQAEDLLGSVPEDQRGQYEDKYGVLAKRLLAEAVNGNDLNQIADVSRRFFYTAAGLEATVLLGHLNLDSGRPALAAAGFSKVANQVRGQQRYDPQVPLLAAISWLLAGNEDRAKSELDALVQRSQSASVTFYDREVYLASAKTDPIGWLRGLVGRSPLAKRRHVEQWLVFRGNAQRQTQSSGGFPLISPRWSFPTIADPVDQRVVTSFRQELIRENVPPVSKLHPLVIDETLVVRTENGILGVDSRTGKRIWAYPAREPFAKPNADRLTADRTTTSAIISLGRLQKLKDRFWLDSIYSQIASDGQSVFLIPNPGMAAIDNNWDGYNLPVVDSATDTRKYNELVSVSVVDQGALRWQIGGESGLDEPQLAKTFFLGPPLPLDGLLYSICYQNKTVRMVALDDESGALQWSLDLASSEEAVELTSDRLRRLAGATPSSQNGILVCPTGLNAVVGVDLATRSLSWGYQFSPPKINGKTLDTPAKFNRIWRDSTLTIADGVVVYTPADSSYLFCLDLYSGESIWQSNPPPKIKRRTAMYVETISNGNIVLAANNKLVAISLADGKRDWSVSLDQYGKISGRGYTSNNQLYLPTTQKKIVRIDLDRKQIDQVVETDQILGNLISHHGDIVSVGVDAIAAYRRDETVDQLLQSWTKNDGPNHEKLALRSQLAFRNQNYRAAVDDIAAAYQAFPNTGYAKILLLALTELIDTDFEYAEKMTRRHQGLFEPSQLRRLRRKRVDGLLASGNTTAAFELLLSMLETLKTNRADQIQPANTVDLVAANDVIEKTGILIPSSKLDSAKSFSRGTMEAAVRMRLSQWIRFKLSELDLAVTDVQKQRFRKQTADFLRGLIDAQPKIESVAVHDLLWLLPPEMVDDEIKLEIAEQLVDDSQILRSNSVMATIAPDKLSPAMAKRTLQIKLKKSIQQNDKKTAAKLIKQLELVETDSTVIEDFNSQLAKAKPFDPKSQFTWNTSSIGSGFSSVVSIRKSEKNAYVEARHPSVVYDSDLPSIEKLSFRYAEFNELQVIDRLGNLAGTIFLDAEEELEDIPQNAQGKVFFHDSLMLYCIGKYMFAIDWNKFTLNRVGSDCLMWSIQNGTGQLFKNVFGSARFDGICFIDGTKLKCVSPFTGQLLWVRDRIQTRSTIKEGQGTVTVWNDGRRTYDQFDKQSGRVLASGEIPIFRGSVSESVGDLQLFKKNLDREPSEKKQSRPNQRGRSNKRSRLSIYDSVQFEMFDFASGQTLWKKKFPFPAVARRITGDRLAIVDGEQNLTVVDFRSGKIQNQHNIQGVQTGDPTGILVYRFKGKDILVVNTTRDSSNTARADGMRVRFYRFHSWGKLNSGYVLALDQQTGDLLWDQPLEIEQFQIAEGTPWASPYLVCLRRNSYEEQPRQFRFQTCLIDLNTGHVVVNELMNVDQQTQNDTYCQFVCQALGESADADAPKQSVELQLGRAVLTVQLSNVKSDPAELMTDLFNQSSVLPLTKHTATKKSESKQPADLSWLIERVKRAEQELLEQRKLERRLQDAEKKARALELAPK